MHPRSPWQSTLRSLLALTALATVHAVDIDLSKQNVPRQFTDPPGKRFSLFAGDPERVQRANEVKLEALTAILTAAPVSFSLAQSSSDSALDLNFVVTNHGKKRQTLSFPDAQRYDLAIVNQGEELVYLWSKDKTFVQTEGMAFLNTGEMLNFRVSLPVSKLKDLVIPGNYRAVMILANYPEVKATADFTIEP
jgi:hypothetical protein